MNAATETRQERIKRIREEAWREAQEAQQRRGDATHILTRYIPKEDQA